MSLSRKIADALDRFESAPDASPNRLLVEDGPHHLTLQVRLATPVGAACDHLEYHRDDAPSRSLDDLKAWSHRLTARLTYLMEPFALHEADAERVELSLRSQAPTVRDHRRAYYEILLDRQGLLRLRRFHYDEQRRQREAVPCQFTREVLERLADDLAATSLA